MLGSLFGDLAPQRLPAAVADSPAAGPVQVAASSEDVVVDGSAAAAIRRHFAEHRRDLQQASAMVTLIDPSRLWASQVVQALSEATGGPLQRLNLRERATLRTLAVIERALVPRRDADALRVYHADLRASAMEGVLAQEEIVNVLAEGSQLTAVIVGAMQPHALLALLRSLLQASRQPGWRCPQLLFMLPPGAAALRQRILEQHWPPQVRAMAVAGPMSCPATVWNCVLAAWEAWESRQIAPADTACGPDRPPPPEGGEVPLALARLLAPLATSDGLLACGIVDLDRGALMASQRADGSAADASPDSSTEAQLAELAAALCAARRIHPAMAPDAKPPDEILVTTGPRQALLRALPGSAGTLGFVALLDRQQANLALLRFRLMEAERRLS